MGGGPLVGRVRAVVPGGPGTGLRGGLGGAGPVREDPPWAGRPAG